MQICIERTGENAILMYFHAFAPNICSFQTQIIDDFSAVWNYGKLSAKFLVISVKVIDTVGYLSFF